MATHCQTLEHIPPVASDTAIKNAKPAAKPYKIQDEKGMYLLVHPNGGKYFRYNYRFNDKRLTLSLDVYPATSLKEAREKLYTSFMCRKTYRL